MLYSKGNKFISIEMHDLLGGAKPGLYVGEGNTFVKVASFASAEKANLFEEQLKYFFGSMLSLEGEVHTRNG